MVWLHFLDVFPEQPTTYLSKILTPCYKDIAREPKKLTSSSSLNSKNQMFGNRWLRPSFISKSARIHSLWLFSTPKFWGSIYSSILEYTILIANGISKPFYSHLVSLSFCNKLCNHYLLIKWVLLFNYLKVLWQVESKWLFFRKVLSYRENGTNVRRNLNKTKLPMIIGIFIYLFVGLFFGWYHHWLIWSIMLVCFIPQIFCNSYFLPASRTQDFKVFSCV